MHGAVLRRLEKNVLLRNLRKLSTYHRRIFRIRNKDYVFDSDHRAHPVHGHLEQRTPRAEEIEELLRHVVTAERPETGTDAATHYHAEFIGFHNGYKIYVAVKD